MEKTMIIAGMTCPHCYVRVETALNNLPGVSARVNVAAKTALVHCNGDVDDVISIATSPFLRRTFPRIR